jgi:hypothetical protein
LRTVNQGALQGAREVHEIDPTDKSYEKSQQCDKNYYADRSEKKGKKRVPHTTGKL